jgi:hypothetical protein
LMEPMELSAGAVSLQAPDRTAWAGLYWILFQLARWTPPVAARTQDPAPIGRHHRWTLPDPAYPDFHSPAARLQEARRRAALARRRAFEGHRSSEGGCTRHGFHKKCPFKFRDPFSCQTSH